VSFNIEVDYVVNKYVSVTLGYLDKHCRITREGYWLASH